MKDRVKGKLDKFTLLNNFEKTISKIKDLKKQDPSFSDDVQKIYLEQINNLIDSTNSYVDLKTKIKSNELKVENSEQFFEILFLAKLYNNRVEIHRQDLHKGMILPGKLPFIISADKIQFNKIEFSDVTYEDLKK